MKVSAALPTGVTALFFEAASRRRRLEARLAERLAERRFSEVILPILDYLEPYAPLLSEATRDELYRFVDRGGELLALRADFTPMLARLLAPRLGELPLPLRLFYRGDVVRYQEERAGSAREFYQLGGEILGLEPEEADSELLGTLLDLLTLGEEPELQIVLGFAGALDELLLAAGEKRANELAAAVERRDRRAVGKRSAALAEIVRHGVPADPDALGEAAGRRLSGLLELAGSLSADFPGVRMTVDLAEFAGLHVAPSLGGGEEAYYDGIVFRAYAGGEALPVAVGGRYDQLFRRLGADVRAVGFSLGVDRLLGSLSGKPDTGPAEGAR